MGRFDAFWKFPAVAHHPVKYASFRQTALASGFAPVAQSNAEHTDLFALGDDLGFRLSSRLLLILGVIQLAHVQANMIMSIEGKCNSRCDNSSKSDHSETAGSALRPPASNQFNKTKTRLPLYKLSRLPVHFERAFCYLFGGRSSVRAIFDLIFRCFFFPLSNG